MVMRILFKNLTIALFLSVTNVCIVRAQLPYISSELDFYISFIDKLQSKSADRILVLHIVKCHVNADCDFHFILSSLYETTLVPYINPRYMFEHNDDLIIIRADKEVDSLLVMHGFENYSSSHYSVSRLDDVINSKDISLLYCYSWTTKGNIIEEMRMRDIERIPPILFFYNDNDIIRVDGKLPE